MVAPSSPSHPLQGCPSWAPVTGLCSLLTQRALALGASGTDGEGLRSLALVPVTALSAPGWALKGRKPGRAAPHGLVLPAKGVAPSPDLPPWAPDQVVALRLLLVGRGGLGPAEGQLVPRVPCREGFVGESVGPRQEQEPPGWVSPRREGVWKLPSELHPGQGSHWLPAWAKLLSTVSQPHASSPGSRPPSFPLLRPSCPPTPGSPRCAGQRLPTPSRAHIWPGAWPLRLADHQTSMHTLRPWWGVTFQAPREEESSPQ